MLCNPVYARRVDPSDLVFLFLHFCIYYEELQILVLSIALALSIHNNKQRKNIWVSVQ
jgi:hypothetical protein